MSGQLATLDYAILFAYLAGTVGLGLYIGRKVKSGQDFFLAGRKLPWWAIGMSLVATDIGGTDIIGVGGAAYSHGLAVANFEWIGCDCGALPSPPLAMFHPPKTTLWGRGTAWMPQAARQGEGDVIKRSAPHPASCACGFEAVPLPGGEGGMIAPLPRRG